MRLRIRAQLLLAFGVVLGLVLISSAIVFFKAEGVANKLDYMKATRVPTLLMTTNVETMLMKARSDLRRVVLSVAVGKIDDAKTYRQKVEDDWTAIDADFAPLPKRARISSYR